MNRKKKGTLVGIASAVLGLVLCLFGPAIRAEAAVDVSTLVTNRNAPFVSYSPDGFAWTIHEPLEGDELQNDMLDNYSYWYPDGTQVSTGVPLSLPVAGVGQHVYTYERIGIVPITYWEVSWRNGRCIHQPAPTVWHGIYGTPEGCRRTYYSGWRGVCADCGKLYNSFILYCSKEKISKMQGVDNTQGYYYECPTAVHQHIELATDPIVHICQDVSYNQYRIVYKNNDVPNVNGQPSNTYHMYNNATEYEGEPAYSATKYLSDNKYGFTMSGYKVIGWDREPGDPYGTPDYTLGQEIYNLTTDDWNLGKEDGTGKGTITLYAVWEKVGAELTLMPGTLAEISKGASFKDTGTAGAVYNSGTKSTTIKVPYLGSYTINNGYLTAPTLGTVTFNTQGGSPLASITVKKEFKAWEKTVPFYGIYKEDINRYAYNRTEDGRKDVLTATWKSPSITLPEPTKSGQVFGGWYEDAACTRPVGSGGAEYTPDGNVTLYAKWSQLVLESTTDLSVDSWKGGVDLTWNQEDARPKFYKIYQKKEGTSTWKQIFSANDIGGGSGWSGDKVEKTTAGTYSLTIPATGFYNVYAYGAQGSDYGSHAGGLGGQVTGKFWLTKGDVLTYTVGSRTQGGAGTTGGSGSYGGGATTVKSTKLGTLLIGGGGGGANFYQGGGAGGLTAGTLSSTTEGANGCGGGGDGYRGGGGGTVNYHAHTSGCYHYHTGDTISGGGCYTLQICGGTFVWTRKGDQNGTYRNTPNYANPGLPGDLWDYVNDRCIQCWGNPCVGGHPKYGPDVYTCNGCGEVQYGSGGACGKQEYKITCGKENGAVICGMTTSTIVSANPAYGGSSYVNSAAVTKTEQPGTRAGNGYFKIAVDTIGCFDSLSLADVPAHDEAEPEKVDAGTVTVEAADGTNVLVSFEKPEDNGTVYYHYAESYLVSASNTVLSTTKASPTYNKITEGVYQYYYVLNTNASTVVTASNKQTTSTTPVVKVAVSTTTVQYLHIAAVDRAGNVSDTIHVKIEPTEVEWNIITEQIGISSTVNGTDYKGIYANGTNRYYVRADGRTPFELKFKSYVQGTADDDYQIDNQQFEVACSGLSNEVFETVLPLSNASIAGTVVLDSEFFERSVHGSDILRDVGHSTANRKSKATINNFTQAFTGNPDFSGNAIAVVPHAGAGYINADMQEDVNWSDGTEDAANKITLILDGERPTIAGLEVLENRELIDRNAGTVTIKVTAMDALSGIKDFYIQISNKDNRVKEKFYPGEDGSIEIELTADKPIFSGDFQVKAYASDHVGNETIIEFETLEFGLRTEVKAIRAPHERLFAGGESGILTITTYGYADRVEVTFPTELTVLNPELNRIYDYTLIPLYKQEEAIQFMIPLGTPASPEYTITVRAYKEGRQIEDYPSIGILAVEGSILDELRTRLR